MALHFTKDFLNDLRASQDARFIREVLNHTISSDGEFLADRNDHRYDGIKNAWIRYVSRGATAYRVIFIRDGADIFLYRAGRHSVEDNLAPPRDTNWSIDLGETSPMQTLVARDQDDACCLLKTTEATFISRHMQALYHVRHKEIYLVSPFIQLALLESNHRFGRFLDRAIEENTIVVLITSGGHEREALPAFQRLEERGVNVFFHPSLHSKVYLFDVDLESRNRWQSGVNSHAIVGSSNLTEAGFGFSDAGCNEELNCRLPLDLFVQARRYVERLVTRSDDYKKHAFKRSRERK